MNRNDVVIKGIEQLIESGEVFCAYVIFNDHKFNKSIWKNLCKKHGFNDFVDL